MWKYVGQRLKESAEQTCSHIKNLRSTFSTCNTNTIQEVAKKESIRRLDIGQDGQTYNIWMSLDKDTSKNKQKKNTFDIDTPYLIQKCYQKQKQKQQEAFNGWMELNLLQMVSKLKTKMIFSHVSKYLSTINKSIFQTAGLLASLYFGQMICFYSRRRQNLKRWHHMEQLLAERSLRQTLEKGTIYQKSYVPSNDWYDANQIYSVQVPMSLVPVTNDHVNLNQNATNTLTSGTQTGAHVSKTTSNFRELFCNCFFLFL